MSQNRYLNLVAGATQVSDRLFLILILAVFTIVEMIMIKATNIKTFFLDRLSRTLELLTFDFQQTIFAALHARLTTQIKLTEVKCYLHHVVCRLSGSILSG